MLFVRATLCLLLLFAMCGSMLAQTQSELNAEACNAYKQADIQLNAIYKQIMREYQTDRPFLEKLKKAQRAWIAYRNAHLDAIYPGGPGAYGSAAPMCRCIVLGEITNRRVEELRQWLEGGAEQEDVCAGSRSR